MPRRGRRRLRKKEDNVDKLYERLISYADSDYYGFHMPGHKRNRNVTGAGLPYEIDITEIEGFDDLHHAKGILKQAQEHAGEVFQGEESLFLVNGSTVGILSAVLGCTQRGDKILMARNCHKSVYHAAYMNELEAEYVYPMFDQEFELNGEIRPEDVRRILEEDRNAGKKKKIRAVVITSPTYDGVVSDVARIAETAHSYGIPLIVDEAHGAHFGFHPYFPENSNVNGADVVIHSIHKTLPALTQTALIHLNGAFADKKRIKNYLHILQSSSPSYILMAGIDACVGWLESEKRNVVFENYASMLKETRSRLKKMRHLQLIETENFDFSKIVISVKGTNYSGRELYGILLEKYHLQMEMAAGSYVLAMTSVGDTREGFQRLVQALSEIDRNLDEESECSLVSGAAGKKAPRAGIPRLEQVFSSSEAEQVWKKKPECVSVLPWDSCPGKISMEYAYIYPPGIPLVVPGERISEEIISVIQEYGRMGFDIEGLDKNGCITVMDPPDVL